VTRIVPGWLIYHKITMRVDLKQRFDFVKYIFVGAAYGNKKRVALFGIAFQRGVVKFLYSAPSFWIHLSDYLTVPEASPTFYAFLAAILPVHA
jgi:hypothetical protein